MKITRVVRHPHGWTFLLNGVYAPASYRTRAIAAERLAFHSAQRTPYYFGA